MPSQVFSNFKGICTNVDDPLMSQQVEFERLENLTPWKQALVSRPCTRRYDLSSDLSLNEFVTGAFRFPSQHLAQSSADANYTYMVLTTTHGFRAFRLTTSGTFDIGTLTPYDPASQDYSSSLPMGIDSPVSDKVGTTTNRLLQLLMISIKSIRAIYECSCDSFTPTLAQFVASRRTFGDAQSPYYVIYAECMTECTDGLFMANLDGSVTATPTGVITRFATDYVLVYKLKSSDTSYKYTFGSISTFGEIRSVNQAGADIIITTSNNVYILQRQVILDSIGLTASINYKIISLTMNDIAPQFFTHLKSHSSYSYKFDGNNIAKMNQLSSGDDKYRLPNFANLSSTTNFVNPSPLAPVSPQRNLLGQMHPFSDCLYYYRYDNDGLFRIQYLNVVEDAFADASVIDSSLNYRAHTNVGVVYTNANCKPVLVLCDTGGVSVQNTNWGAVPTDSDTIKYYFKTAPFSPINKFSPDATAVTISTFSIRMAFKDVLNDRITVTFHSANTTTLGYTLNTPEVVLIDLSGSFVKDGETYQTITLTLQDYPAEYYWIEFEAYAKYLKISYWNINHDIDT